LLTPGLNFACLGCCQEAEFHGACGALANRWSDAPSASAEPTEDAPEAHPTLILTPLLAFDAKGNRLGYGKGHYDQALQTLRSEGRAFACAVAYAAQQIDDVPAEPHDQPLDWAITPAGSIPLFMMRNMSALKQGLMARFLRWPELRSDHRMPTDTTDRSLKNFLQDWQPRAVVAVVVVAFALCVAIFRLFDTHRNTSDHPPTGLRHPAWLTWPPWSPGPPTAR
jgi:hypothetical protein